MDKYEYKVRADEIKTLIADGEFAKAVKIADTIDWRRVKSVMTLCTISDLYKINRRYQESRDILLLAYERHPGGRLIVYSLCELSIKLEEYVQAIEYYKEFVQIAPKDSGRYILQYKLYEAQDVGLEERIAVLEDLKKHDYREKWAYELAYLYHRVGLGTKCVEECDEMFLWFGEGKYVMKALELKALHEPLTQEQGDKYDWMKAQREAARGERVTPDEEDPASYDNDSYEAGEQGYDSPEGYAEEYGYGVGPDYGEETDYGAETGYSGSGYGAEESYSGELPEGEGAEDAPEQPKDIDIQVKTVDVGQYNTINLQKALAESMKEVLDDEDREDIAGEKGGPGPVTQAIIAPLLEDTGSFGAWPGQEPAQVLGETGGKEEPERQPVREEVFFGDTRESAPVQVEEMQQSRNGNVTPFRPAEKTVTTQEPAHGSLQDSSRMAPPVTAPPVAHILPQTERKSGFERMLSQEYDGQISLVVPEDAQLEKQITGQISIGDVMAEWEKTKKQNEEKRKEDVRKRVLEQTGSLFSEFDEATKSGLLEHLERAVVEAILKETGGKLENLIPGRNKSEEEENRKIAEAAKELLEDEVHALEKQKTGEPAEMQEAGGPAGEAQEAGDAEAAEIPAPAQPRREEPARARHEERTPEQSDVTGGESRAAEEETAADTEQPREAGGAVRTRRAGNDGGRNARSLTPEERELFGPYIHHRKTREQILDAVDKMSLAAYTGNVIVTGEEGSGTLSLAKSLIREIQMTDNNFSGKVAKVSGGNLNNKDVAATLGRLVNGALIVENASALKRETIGKLSKALDQEDHGLVVILEGGKERMDSLLSKNPVLNDFFNTRVDIEALNDDALVAYARQYALDMEYAIDDLGVLALHTRIADMQTSDHEVTVSEVKELVDDAIYFADKKTPGHFFDILLGKRYDDEDMIILREKDFMHY